MVRRQDCKPATKYSTVNFFKFPKKYNQKFLGKQLYFVEQNDLCNIDIDTKKQMNIFQEIIE